MGGEHLMRFVEPPVDDGDGKAIRVIQFGAGAPPGKRVDQFSETAAHGMGVRRFPACCFRLDIRAVIEQNRARRWSESPHSNVQRRFGVRSGSCVDIDACCEHTLQNRITVKAIVKVKKFV
jgi:hypothetical protein